MTGGLEWEKWEKLQEEEAAFYPKKKEPVSKELIEVMLIAKRARRDHARGYQFNSDMQIEAELLDKEIEALEKGRGGIIMEEEKRRLAELVARHNDLQKCIKDVRDRIDKLVEENPKLARELINMNYDPS